MMGSLVIGLPWQTSTAEIYWSSGDAAFYPIHQLPLLPVSVSFCPVTNPWFQHFLTLLNVEPCCTVKSGFSFVFSGPTLWVASASAELEGVMWRRCPRAAHITSHLEPKSISIYIILYEYWILWNYLYTVLISLSNIHIDSMCIKQLM